MKQSCRLADIEAFITFAFVAKKTPRMKEQKRFLRMSKDDSRCRKGKYHQFEVSRSLEDANIEVCVLCSKKVVYYKEPITGRIDNKKYLADHIRDFCQPRGKTRKVFEKLYGRNRAPQRPKKLDNRTLDERRRELEQRIKRQYL